MEIHLEQGQLDAVRQRTSAAHPELEGSRWTIL
jgi:hypothetical protein